MKKTNLQILLPAFLLWLLCFTACSFNSIKTLIKDITPVMEDEEEELPPQTLPQTEAEPEPAPAPTPLTLLVYMAADNDLESYALANIKAMESVEQTEVNILVLVDRAEAYDQTNGDWTDTRLYRILYDSYGNGNLVSQRLDCGPLGLAADMNTELDMANPFVLQNFISFAKKNYSSEEYALIIWGHGTGWRGLDSAKQSFRAVAIDDKTSSFMTVSDLGKAVRNKGLCVIGFDTCFGGVLENVYELKDCASYTVAAAGMSPSLGWDYKELVLSLSQALAEKNDMEPAKLIARTMAASSPLSLTLFKNENIQNLFQSFEDFSKALSQTITDSSSRNYVYDKLFACNSYSYISYPCDMYLDLFSLGQSFLENPDKEVSEAAQALILQLDQTCSTRNFEHAKAGVLFIPRLSSFTAASVHDPAYFKNDERNDQCAFIKESRWWVPTLNGNSGSLLDKIFYTSY